MELGKSNFTVQLLIHNRCRHIDSSALHRILRPLPTDAHMDARNLLSVCALAAIHWNSAGRQGADGHILNILILKCLQMLMVMFNAETMYFRV